MEGKDLKKKMDGMWKTASKDFDAFLKQASLLVKKGEVFLKDTSQRGQKELEVIALNLQREKLYYDLGKVEGSLPRRRNAAKKKSDLLRKIKAINDKIKKLKRS